MFERFPSLTRFSQGWSISEKIDGTNAQIYIADIYHVPYKDGEEPDKYSLGTIDDRLHLFAGSRTRIITPDTDNHGFARWARDNAEMLIRTLGEGRHFGEWWGQGIQRGYGLQEKRFSLFNTLRWKQKELPEGLYVVPLVEFTPFIGEGVFTGDARFFNKVDNEYLSNPGFYAEKALEVLQEQGSVASPGFMDPEGIVMFHRASGVAFKKTFDYDEYGKWMENQERKNA